MSIPLTAEQLDSIRSLILDGLTNAQVVKFSGCSLSSVVRQRRLLGVPSPPVLTPKQPYPDPR